MGNQVIAGNQNATILLNKLKKSNMQYDNLTKAQEREMIESYKHDKNKLVELLCMHNLKLVFNISKKYMSKTNDFDGLIQDGILGLMEAANRFDPDKDVKFCTYAYIWIKKYMTMHFYGKQVELDKRTTSLNATSVAANVKSNNGNEVTLESYVNDKIDPTERIYSIESELSSNERMDICKDLMKTLDEDTSLTAIQKAVFVDMFYNKEKPKSLAEKYDLTLKDVSTIKTLVLSKFKNILVNSYNIASYADLA